MNGWSEIEPPDLTEGVRIVPGLVLPTVPGEPDLGRCVLCDETIAKHDAWQPLNREQVVHHECQLRGVVGGIGHQLAHEWWCLVKRDPDAGLTYRQSAQMVMALIDVVGIDEVSRRCFVVPERMGDDAD